jgi:O-acetyl-ADP-ribose deacetylase (regulator of RNase III)
MEKKLGDILLKIHLGDITELQVDAIVNAANSDLWMGSGVAGAIKAKGGQEIEDEAISLGPIRPGEAVLTTGGRLPAKYVLHCALGSVQKALEIASDRKLTSVAFPAIGAGVGGLSEQESANAIVEGIHQHSRSHTSVKEITLVGLSKYACDSFIRAIDELEE